MGRDWICDFDLCTCVSLTHVRKAITHVRKAIFYAQTCVSTHASYAQLTHSLRTENITHTLRTPYAQKISALWTILRVVHA